MAIADITTKIRGNLIIDSYRQWLKPKSKVLDVGCGNGIISEVLYKHFNLDLTGCDILGYLTRPIKFVQMKSENELPFRNKQFDIVMFNDVLHHIYRDDQEKLIKEAVRVSKHVLIFELKPTIIGTVSDWAINKIHNWNMRIPFTYRSIDQWCQLFKKLKLTYEIKRVDAPRWYPFSHVGFRISNI